ncbi:hypothetical protein [Sunxiuqinia sp. sy24]|uniref:hypothetical protein n=1 Tax=Sunxiuqinia sp. sy24 TaxID=3461495 RepID=UPI004046607E
MKYIGLSTTLLLFLLSSCSGQPRSDQMESLDSITPKTDIVVNRQFDENGNLIRYDSTYTQFYNSVEQDSLMADSILNEFKDRFNLQYPFSDRSYFNDFFFQDSLLQYDFYKKNFFYERFQNNMKRMDSLFQEMDSMKNRFFMDQFPQNK